MQGADIVCGDIQSLGLHQWFGGAHGGFIAVHDDPRFIMEMPSRLFGLATTDVPGEYGFGDVAYDRTSFAHREEGKEWVGTAAALWGIAAGVYLALMGPQGMRDLGEVLLARTRYAQQQLAAIPGIALGDDAVHLREFTIDLAGSGLTATGVVDALRAEGIEPGVARRRAPLLVCVTEMTSQLDIDRLAAAIAARYGLRPARPTRVRPRNIRHRHSRGAERMSLPVAPKPALRRFQQASWDEPIIFELSTPGERGVLVTGVEPGVRDAVGDVVADLPVGTSSRCAARAARDGPDARAQALPAALAGEPRRRPQRRHRPGHLHHEVRAEGQRPARRHARS